MDKILNIIGYTNNQSYNQQNFILVISDSIKAIVLETKWENCEPKGLYYNYYDCEVVVYNKRIQVECERGNFRLVFDLNNKSDSYFTTGLAAYDSGSTGSLNQECVLIFIENYVKYSCDNPQTLA